VYKAHVQRAVKWVLEQGLTAIIDLHWVGPGTDVGQKEMPDGFSRTFWQEVADLYKGDGRVLFELYNEPYGIDVNTWRNGGGGFVGMQELYTIVRGRGANNHVLIGGRDYAYDLSHLSNSANAITGSNIVYVTHPYVFKTSPAPDQAYLNIANTYPVMATEFGDANVGGHYVGPNDCNVGAYTTPLSNFQSRGISWTGWAWYVEAETRCGFPTLIDRYDGTATTPPGNAIRAALGGP
jgi:hypothetical protein